MGSIFFLSKCNSAEKEVPINTNSIKTKSFVFFSLLITKIMFFIIKKLYESTDLGDFFFVLYNFQVKICDKQRSNVKIPNFLKKATIQVEYIFMQSCCAFQFNCAGQRF